MQLYIFKYQHDQYLDPLTTVEINGEVWFVASEVCKMLDIKNVSDAVARLDNDEKNTIVISDSITKSSKGNPNKLVVSESGLYALAFGSSKPEAKKFRKWVTQEVIPAIRKTGGYQIDRYATPNFVRRYNDNWDRTDKGYFSVISELFIRLYGRFENLGYTIPDKAFDEKEMRPDVSVGLTFSSYLKKHHRDVAENFKMYDHKFPSGLEVPARQYHNDLLPLFIKFIDDVWIPEYAEDYFKKRDRLALDYLPKLLPPRK